MAEKSSFAAALTAASIFIVGALGGAGYAGYLTLEKKIAALQNDTQRVVVDLGAELIGELQKSDWNTAIAESGATDGETQREIRDTLKDLKSAIETVSTRQAAIAETLAKPAPPAEVDKTESSVEERMERAQTVYFDKGAMDGEEVDRQIGAVIAGIGDFVGRPDCFATVDGFSDTVGSDIANLKLSRERADYVAAKVRRAGVKVASVTGWGERRLEMHTFDGVDNRRNRRVVVSLNCSGNSPQSPVPVS